MAAPRQRRQSGWAQFIEGSVFAGAAFGLWVSSRATGHFHVRHCHSASPGACIGRATAAAVAPMVTGAIIGAVAGLAISVAVLMLWRAVSGRPPGHQTRPARRPIPERVRNQVWRRDQGRCVDCGSRELLEYDHIIAVANGGSHSARNLELRCAPCNQAKGASI